MLRQLQRRFRKAPSEERIPIVDSIPPSTSPDSTVTPPTPQPPSPYALRLFPSLGWKFQKYCTYGISATFFLLGGLEYGVVLPSLWQFLETRFDIGNDGIFLGLTMAAFSATSFVTCPLVGLVVDRVDSAKKLLLLGCTLSALGNILYFLALNKWYVLIGRIFCGAGYGCRPALLADITRNTTPEERTGIITIMLVFPQLGYFVGPAINIILANFDFYVFYEAVHVDKYTAAGFFSACLFLFLLVVAAFFYFDLKRVRLLEALDGGDKELKDIMEDAFENDGDVQVASTTTTTTTTTTTQEQADDDDVIDVEKKNATASSSSSPAFPTPPPKEAPSFCSAPCSFLHAYIRDEIIVILCLVFNCTFASVAVETAAFPWMDFLFGWTILANSMFGSVACGGVIITYFFLHRLSKKYDDRIILLALQGIAVFSLLWLMIAFGQGMKYAPLFRQVGGAKGIGGIDGDLDMESGIWQVLRQSAAWQTLIIIGFAFFFVSVPSINVISTSLLSKLLTNDMQGLGQGAQQNMASVANIIGPLWAGALLWTDLYVMMGVEIFLFILGLAMFLGSWTRLKTTS